MLTQSSVQTKNKVCQTITEKVGSPWETAAIGKVMAPGDNRMYQQL